MDHFERVVMNESYQTNVSIRFDLLIEISCITFASEAEISG